MEPALRLMYERWAVDGTEPQRRRAAEMLAIPETDEERAARLIAENPPPEIFTVPIGRGGCGGCPDPPGPPV